MITLTKLSETATKITLGWSPVPGAIGYRFQSAATAPKWSHTWDSSRSQVTFSKADWYKVEALGLEDAGEYPASTPPPPTTGAPVGTWRIATNAILTVGDPKRYQFITANAWEHGRIAGFKAKNPDVEMLVYKCISSTRSYTDDTTPPAGIGWTYANSQHPEWFALGVNSGQRLEWPGYGGHWQMNVGNPAYQNKWAENVIAECQANGWDGIAADNANLFPYGEWPASTPNASTFQAATRSFLANVGPKLRAAGIGFYPNISAHGDTTTYGPSMWADWCQFTDGASREFWMKWGFDSSNIFSGNEWQSNRNIMEAVQALGKRFIAITYAPRTDTRIMRYCYASFLLSWNGTGPSCFVFEGMPEDQDPWNAEWTKDIGKPTAAATPVSGGWKRTYTGGTVYVNPSSSQTVTIDGRSLSPMTGLIV